MYRDGITPQRTWYAGVEYASKLEAEYAQCWHEHDLLHMFEYEAESFLIVNTSTARISYTPDFFIENDAVTENLAVIEIKPTAPTDEEIARATLLVSRGHVPYERFRFFVGAPDGPWGPSVSKKLDCYGDWHRNWGSAVNAYWERSPERAKAILTEGAYV